MNTIVSGSDCSCAPCPTPSGGGAGPVGPPGPTGAAGSNGSNGINSFTTTTAGFTMPAVSASVTVAVADSTWMAIGQVVYVTTAGYFSVNSTPTTASASLTNLGYTGNAAPTTVIGNTKTVSPGGVKGADGAAGSATLNQLSPTTTKGDIIVDNGANNPLASDVRLAAGANGTVFVSDSAQATGRNQVLITPLTVTNANDIPRFSGTGGTPMTLKDSKLLITDDGAIQSTPSGGNARGSKAVDLQVDRAANTQVASGVDSTISGGRNNTASGLESTVPGGFGNVASGSDSVVGGGNGGVASGANSTVAGGNANTASGDYSGVLAGGGNSATGLADSVVGGTSNTASGGGSSVLAGDTNTANAPNSTVIGGSKAIASHFGQITHASGSFSVQGDAQASELLWKRLTIDATANVEMFLDGSSARAIITLNTSWAFHIHIIARSSAGVCAAFDTKGAIQNNGGTVTLVAAVTQAVIADGTGGSWGVTGSVVVDADNTFKSLRIRVTGAAATNIRWNAHARLVELTF